MSLGEREDELLDTLERSFTLTCRTYSSAVGWAVGHSEIGVLDQIVDRTDTDREPWTMGKPETRRVR